MSKSKNEIMARIKLQITLLVLFFSHILTGQTPCGFDCDYNLPCISYDIVGDLDGFSSSTVLCPVNIAKEWFFCQNTSWAFPEGNDISYSFIAGSSDITVALTTSNCSLAPNYYMQSLLADPCNYDCLAWGGPCSTGETQEFSYYNLVVGKLYSISFFGCFNNDCDFEVSVSDQAPFIMDEVYSISAYSVCQDLCLTSDCQDPVNCNIDSEITVRPSEEIKIKLRHQGNSPTDFGDFDEACSFYSPILQATFIWELDGEEYEISSADVEDNEFTFTIPETEDSYTTELCIKEIIQGNVVLESDLCIDLIVEEILPETFNYKVCVEDLIDGWFVPEDDDPNGDGYTWLADPFFTIDDFGQNSCLEFTSQVPNCNLYISQTLCIDKVGSTNNIERQTLYMFDSQFDENGDYQWDWEDAGVYEFNKDDLEDNFYIEEVSFETDWLLENCDTAMNIFIEIYEIQGNLICNDDSSPTKYSFELDNVDLEVNHSKWPQIEEYKVKWISCTNNEVLYNQNTIEINEDQELCVEVSFEFYDGAWLDPKISKISKKTSTIKKFGPYALTTSCNAPSAQTCPRWNETIQLKINGINSSCSSPCELSKDDQVQISVTEHHLPNGAQIDWYISDNPDFTPEVEGNLVATSSVQSNWVNCSESVEILAIGYNERLEGSEYLIIGSGEGLSIGNLLLEANNNCDNSCPADCINGTYGSDCQWEKRNTSFLSGCSNIISVGPNDFIPPNSILILFIDTDESIVRNITEQYCTSEDCVYVLFNNCERCLDAFTNIGSGSYSIFGCTENTITYNGDNNMGHVTSDGQYNTTPNSLPSINVEYKEITASVTDATLSLNCTEYSGTQFLKGVVKSEIYNTNCCSPYTSTLDIYIQCDTDTENEDDNEIFNEYPWLADIIDLNNCTGTSVQVYDLGSYSFIYIKDEDSGTLYLGDGTRYCGDSPNFSCLDAYGLTTPTAVWQCGETTNPPPSTPQIFDDYPFLNNLVDLSNCEGTTISLYEFGSQLFPYVSSTNSSILYSNTGQTYCTSSLPSFDCISIYGLAAPISVWECDDDCACPSEYDPICGVDGNSYNNSCEANCAGVAIDYMGECTNSDPLFDEYEWLNDIFSSQNCTDEKITIYQRGGNIFLFIESNGTTIMYNSAGQLYCQDYTNFSCITAYGFTNSEIIETWVCPTTQPIQGTPFTNESVKTDESSSYLIYPNPSHGLFTLVNKNKTEILNLKVFNSNGKLILNNNDSHQINLSDFNSGIYILKIENSSGYTMKRLIVL